MDSIDPGSYLSSLMAGGNRAASSGSAPPAATNGATLDSQILALAATPPGQGSPVSSTAPSAEGGADLDQKILALAALPSAQDTQIDPNAAAAKAAYDAEQSKPAHLTVGLGTKYWETPIPIPHWLDNTIGGAGGRALQLGEWAKQSLGGGAPDPLNAAVAQQSQTGTAGKTGSFLTDVGLTAPIGGAVTTGLGRLTAAAAPRLAPWLAGNVLGRAAVRIAPAAVQGATQGALTAPPGERLEGAALGAALSPVLPVAGAVGGKVIRGLTRTPEAQALLDRGVSLTPGQMNPEGAVTNRLEQAFTALPLVGGLIAKARAAGPAQFARSMVQDAVAPGEKLTTATTDYNGLIADAQAGFDRAYDQTLRSSAPGGGFQVQPTIAGANGSSTPLSAAFQQIASVPRLGLTAAQRDAMGQQLQDKLAETVAVANRANGMTADDLQQLRSDLRATARDVSPTDSASRAQRAFWNDAQATVTRALESQLPTDTAQALRAIDQQYGKFAIARRAAVLAKDQPGGPTPAQFSQAVKEATPPNAYAAGGGFNRDATKAARSVFQSTVPQTGLTGIGTVLPVVHGAELGVGGMLSMHHPLAGLAALTGLGGIAGAYTRPGLRFLAGQTGVQRALQGAMGRVPGNATEALSRYGRAALMAPALAPQLQPQGAPLAPWMAAQ